MGQPKPEFDSAEDTTAQDLVSSLNSISPAERRRHATVFNYWLSIRGDRSFPSVRDLDPLEISDAGPSSVLLELVGEGEDAEIRHTGQALEPAAHLDRISQAARPSLLSCIADRLTEVASSRQAVAFEDEFVTEEGTTRCSVTLLPFSTTGLEVDYVYGFVSSASDAANGEPAPESEPEVQSDGSTDTIDLVVPLGPIDQEEEVAVAEVVAAEAEAEVPTAEQPSEEQPGEEQPGEEQPAEAADVEPEVVPQPKSKPAKAAAGGLQGRLADARAKADEARLARLQAETSLVHALSEAYDFAVDAEGSATEYLKLVEEKGLTIQLRSPMAPVVRLAFDGLTDDATIADLEKVMAWALRMNLPRGSLADRVTEAGGLAAAVAEAAQGR